MNLEEKSIQSLQTECCNKLPLGQFSSSNIKTSNFTNFFFQSQDERKQDREVQESEITFTVEELGASF